MNDDITWQTIQGLFRRVLEEETGSGKCSIANKWDGGTVVLKPADPNLKSVEIPMEAFFKKVTSVREKLRVLEQKLNNHPTLTPEEKHELQVYITRAYGSLTSFNVLFRDEDDRFKGSGGA
jgi:hypothetical protein